MLVQYLQTGEIKKFSNQLKTESLKTNLHININ